MTDQKVFIKMFYSFCGSYVAVGERILSECFLSMLHHQETVYHIISLKKYCKKCM
jgi:hypothetical protein